MELNKYFYLLEQNDLVGIENKIIEESIRQSGLDTLCNKPDEYLSDNLKQYLNKCITLESNSIRNPTMKTYTYRQYITYIFKNANLFSHDNKFCLTDFIDFIYEKSDFIKLELRLRASKILFGNYYFKKTIYQLNTNEINIFCQICNVSVETMTEAILKYKNEIMYKYLNDIDSLNIHLRNYTIKILNNRFKKYKKI